MKAVRVIVTILSLPQNILGFRGRSIDRRVFRKNTHVAANRDRRRFIARLQSKIDDVQT
ncbi:MAG: hypothetical protein ACJA2Q_001486 [Pseudohongiellaceae bacterium]|jgi:hypothetical protein